MSERQPPRSAPKGTKASPDELAIAALGFLAADPERLARFLAETGLGPQSLRAAAREPGFLLGVLDHVASDESLMLAFAEENGVDPQDVERARAMLAGRRGDTGAA